MAADTAALHSPHVAHPWRARVRHFVGLDLKILMWTVAILAVIRMLMPFAIKEYVNRTLDKIPEYDGHITDVDLSLWRGAYQIVGIEIVKTDGNVPVPFFKAPRVDFSVEWEALLDGALVGEVEFHKPVVNIVAADTAEDSQTGVGKEWQTQVQRLFPLRINRFEIKDGELHFRNFQKSPDVDIFLKDTDVLVTNLTNSRKVSKTLWAQAEATGETLGGGKVSAKMSADPYAELPTFNMDFELKGLQLKELNEFFKAYGKFDVEGGTFDVYTEVASEDGYFKGYVKPMFYKLRIFDPKEKHRNLGEAFREAIIAGGAELLQNQKEEHLSARVPLAGELKDPSVGLFDAGYSVLRNAFVRALLPKLDATIDMKDAPTSIKDIRNITDQDILKRLRGDKPEGKKDAKKEQKEDKDKKPKDEETGAAKKEAPPPKILR